MLFYMITHSANMKRLFVTVGTTKFSKLVDTITQLQTIQVLARCQYSDIQIQTGCGFEKVTVDSKLQTVVKQGATDKSWIVQVRDFNIVISYNQYFEDFEEQIKKADLIISHAGAGSCLDILRLGKPLIVVVNEDLMDNHQIELADQLQHNGNVYFCICDSLSSTLCKDLSQLKQYPKTDENLFVNYLDKCCGFQS